MPGEEVVERLDPKKPFLCGEPRSHCGHHPDSNWKRMRGREEIVGVIMRYT